MMDATIQKIRTILANSNVGLTHQGKPVFAVSESEILFITQELPDLLDRVLGAEGDREVLEARLAADAEALKEVYRIATRQLAEPTGDRDRGALVEIATAIEKIDLERG